MCNVRGMTAQDMALPLHHIESEDAMSNIEEIKAKLGLGDDELKALLVGMGFKPKAVKVESAELIARRAELDAFLALEIGSLMDGDFRQEDETSWIPAKVGDIIAYADHLRAEMKELKPRTIAATKQYEQTDGFKMVLIELNADNAAKAGHGIAVLDIDGSSNWRSVMTANGYTLGQVGMVSKGHRDHATHRNGYAGKGNLGKHALFAQCTAEQVELVELTQKAVHG